MKNNGKRHILILTGVVVSIIMSFMIVGHVFASKTTDLDILPNNHVDSEHRTIKVVRYINETEVIDYLTVNNIHAGKHIATSTVCDKDGNILSVETVEFTADEDIFVKQKNIAFIPIPIIW